MNTKYTSFSPARGRLLSLLLALPVLIGVALLSTGTAYAANATVDQCSGVLNQGGQTVRCTVSVTNTLDVATGVGSSSVTVQVCTGAIGAPTCGPPTTTSSQDIVTTVSQCNGSSSGGGGEVACQVDVVNNVTGGATPTPATVNQCVGSADGSGTMTCNPLSSTSGATVTQCNGSANGGGSTLTCTVDAASTASASLPVTVNQCNGSANGGGALVTCRTSITNNVLARPAPAPTATASASATPSATPSTSPSSTHAPSTSPAPTASSLPTRAPTSAPRPTASATGTSTGTGLGTPAVPAVDVRGVTTASPTAASLPRTGADSGLLGLLGLVSVTGGIALLVVGRRPRGRHVLR